MTTEKNKPIMLPEGRVINCSVFEKDAFKGEDGAPGEPMYKMELAFDPAQLVEAEDALVAVAVDKWGAGAAGDYDAGRIASPLLDGNVLKAAREERKKNGDAYANKLVIRPNTKFNKHGEDAPGGIYVCGSDAVEIGPAQWNEIYSGVYGIAVVQPAAYVAGSKKGTKFYLVAFQKTRDGERLASTDHSSLFNAVGAGKAAPTGRRGAR